MRGDDEQTGHMFSYLSPEQRVPADHPLRAIRSLTDAALRTMSRRFARLYAKTGRPSIPPEQLLRALLLQVLYSVRSERLLMEELRYNLLFRWFVGLNMDDPVWHPTTFTKNRDRLLAGEVAAAFFDAVAAQARTAGLLSDEHFTVDGTQLEAWASLKSFQRRNDTHASTTDPEARLYRKGPGREAKLAYLGHVLLDNRHGLVANVGVTAATGTAERVGRAVVAGGRRSPGQHRRCRQRLRRRALRPGRPGPWSHAACRAESTPQRDRRPHHAPRRLCRQSAQTQAGGTGLWVDENGRWPAEVASSRWRIGGLDRHLRGGGVQLGPHPEFGGGMSLIEGRIERGPTTRGRPPRTSIRSEKEAPA